tara:strand:- start:42 stop:551 length:510 start_codon:yes stop_codon:yes gene_type:complete
MKFTSNTSILIPDIMEVHTQALAKFICPLLKKGDTVLLYGNVGSGKTSLARHIIQNRFILQGVVVDEVPSPTFTLVQFYDSIFPPIWHVDLYRLSNEYELIELDFLDNLNSCICLIEWPEIMRRYIPLRHISIKFDCNNTDHKKRDISLEMHGKDWEYLTRKFFDSSIG